MPSKPETADSAVRGSIESGLLEQRLGTSLIRKKATSSAQFCVPSSVLGTNTPILCSQLCVGHKYPNFVFPALCWAQIAPFCVPSSLLGTNTPILCSQLCVGHKYPNFVFQLCVRHKYPNFVFQLCVGHKYPNFVFQLCVRHKYPNFVFQLCVGHKYPNFVFPALCWAQIAPFCVPSSVLGTNSPEKD